MEDDLGKVAARLTRRALARQTTMKMDGRMHICLVCHTEPDVWNGGFSSIDTVLPQFLEVAASVHDKNGVTPRVAWCLTSQVVENRPGPFRKLLSAGHEIGVHSHFPGTTSKLEHDRKLNAQNLDLFDDWFPELCNQIEHAGFPRPMTHATWMFAYRDDMTRTLADAGIRAECSVCYGGQHSLPDGFPLADSRNRTTGKPYRLAVADHCSEGSSPVVELPVSGGLGCYWEPDAAGNFQFFSPVASDPELNRLHDPFRNRLSSLAPDEIDIFHVHFHVYEFLPSDGTGQERLARAKRLLTLFAKDNRVVFSTPSQAIEDWKKREGIANKTDARDGL